MFPATSVSFRISSIGFSTVQRPFQTGLILMSYAGYRNFSYSTSRDLRIIKQYPPKSSYISKSNFHRQFHSTGNARKETELPGSNLLDPLTSLSNNTSDLVVDIAQRGDLVALGLANNTPVGLLQNGLEWLHVAVGLPWWASIVAMTIGVRTLLFPLVGKQMVNSARLSNIQPELMQLSQSIQQNMKIGNRYEAQLKSTEMQSLLRTHNCNPLRSLLLPLVQMPIFLSFFLAIKGMTDLPVNSFKTGGLLWFSDLAVADPYYILPVASALSFLATVELGVDGVNNKAQAKTMRNVFRGLSLVMIPFTANLPAGVFVYWLASSFSGIVQMLIFRIPLVKKYFAIPALNPEAASRLLQMQNVKGASSMSDSASSKGIFESVKTSWSSAKEIAEERSKASETLTGATSSSSSTTGSIKISPNKIIMRK